ncbi:T9SS type A sorting domain-containing protein [Taibaiella koreensis]|uniref:T9SS type A sorting domain-containing protein n=1 Tax=Taibaiella koreensis TaxID=1268548 RepID=UPI000E59F4D2|nr:T9SS type A sorting domain-containing protein [Taibaiella koreensis]
MKKKTFRLLAGLIALTGSVATAQNAVVPLYFHGSPATMSTPNAIQVLYSTVCQINYNYRSNNVAVSFFIAGIDDSNPAYGANAYAGGINIYNGQNDNTSDGYSKIKAAGIDASVLTHEIGHCLSLLHPEGNNPPGSGCSGAGDPDCCSDTPPVINGNWMNQGNMGTGTFTACQASRVYSSCIGHGFSTSGALSFSSNYVVPVESLNPATGLLGFRFDNGCPGAALPNYITCEIHTYCGNGADQSVINQTITNYSQPTYISNCWGIRYIIYKFAYNGGNMIHTKRVDYNYTNPNACACTLTPPGGESKPAAPGSPDPLMTSDENKLYIHTDATQLFYHANNDYERMVIYDMAGRNLSSQQLTGKEGHIDISSLPHGIFLFKAIGHDGKIKVLKFQR